MLKKYKGKIITFDDPDGNTPPGNIHHEVKAEDLLEQYKEHYKSMSVKVNKPMLADDEIIEDLIVILWAQVKKVLISPVILKGEENENLL
jgi:hypothetical protein